MSSEDDVWNTRTARCPKAAVGFEPYHKWFPVSKSIAGSVSVVTGIMCGICFYEVVVQDAHKHRDCFKTL